MKTLIVDIARCNGCFNCQLACKDEHCGADWSPIAKPQPLTGQFWMKVTEKVRGQVPVVHVNYLPQTCGHCETCSIVEAAPDMAYRRDDGIVIIDPEKAKGRKDLVGLCPADAVYWNEELEIAQKCTGCAHLLDEGWEAPRCVDACSTNALIYGEEEDLADLLKDAEPWPGLENRGTRVYYRNLPKRFAAVSVIDFEADEVVSGATVSLIASDGSVADKQQTDEFGDYFHDSLNSEIYTMLIEAEGYADKRIEVDLTKEDRTLGDIGIEWLGGERKPLDRTYTPAFKGVVTMQKKDAVQHETGAGRAEAVGGEGAIAAAAAAELAAADEQFKNTAAPKLAPK